MKQISCRQKFQSLTCWPIWSQWSLWYHFYSSSLDHFSTRYLKILFLIKALFNYRLTNVWSNPYTCINDPTVTWRAQRPGWWHRLTSYILPVSGARSAKTVKCPCVQIKPRPVYHDHHIQSWTKYMARFQCHQLSLIFSNMHDDLCLPQEPIFSTSCVCLFTPLSIQTLSPRPSYVGLRCAATLTDDALNSWTYVAKKRTKAIVVSHSLTTPTTWAV